MYIYGLRSCYLQRLNVQCAADGDEGGRHQLITAAIGNGVLYILKVILCDPCVKLIMIMRDSKSARGLAKTHQTKPSLHKSL